MNWSWRVWLPAILLAMDGFAPLSILGLVKLIHLLRPPRRPLKGMTEIEAMLRGAHAFSKVTLCARKEREGLPVVVRDGDLDFEVTVDGVKGGVKVHVAVNDQVNVNPPHRRPRGAGGDIHHGLLGR